MNEILTHNNKMISPFETKHEDIIIDDIAHSLSYLCRANGHFGKFYSVAQHSINCALEAKARNLSTKIQLACLLHDSAEAYMSDIPLPAKQKFPAFIDAEEKLLEVIYSKFLDVELTEDELSEISKIDRILLNEEFIVFKHKAIYPNLERVKSGIYLQEESFSFFKEKFLTMFSRLINSGIQSQPICNPNKKQRSFVGIDGCGGKGGMWLTVEINEFDYEVRRFESIEDLYNIYDMDDVILIDVPIGLPDDLESLKKRPDSQLRKELKGKSSSVFNTPFRPVVYELNHETARALSRKMGKGVTVQSLAIGKYIRDVDTFLRNNEQYKNIIMESHPEFCFKLLNDGHPILSKKSKSEGINERINVLSKYFPLTNDLLEYGTNKYGKNIKIKGDIVDALCLAICAKIGYENEFASIPKIPDKDKHGLKMQIVYPVMQE